MEVVKTAIEGVFILEPKVFKDARGYFLESYNRARFREVTGLDIDFVQDNESLSTRGVLRGFHFQRPPHSQSKLVRCTRGRVLDVAIDIRQGSPTFGRHVAVELSEENHRQFFIPRGFAHGFAVLSEVAVLQYKCDCFYAPDSEGGINILDDTLGVHWPFSMEYALLSDKDLKHACLKDFDTPFDYNEDLYPEFK